ncbi:hypothetical protein ACFE04_003889 [Oxalis oulophora]
MAKTMKTNNYKVDRASALPIDIRYIILSFLPTADQFSASLVSKSWKSTWDLLTTLSFDETLFKKRCQLRGNYYEHSSFVKFVEYCIRSQGSLHLQTSNLHMTEYMCYETFELVDRWMKFLLKKSLKVLQLKLECKGYHKYMLPCSSLACNSLDFLSLEGCKLSEYALGDSIEFGASLKELHLNNVDILQSTFNRIICCCPMITTLELVKCSRIKEVSISTLPNLLSVHIEEIYQSDETRVEISSSTLQSFCYSERFLFDLPLLLTCINLVQLTFKTLYIVNDNDKHLQSLISKFPFLRALALVLVFFNGMHVFRISSLSLKILKIQSTCLFPQLHIDAPNLEELEMSFPLKDKNQLKSSVFKDSSKLQKIKLNSRYCKLWDICFFIRAGLRDFLRKFAQKIILNLEFESLELTWDWNHDESGIYAVAPVSIEHLNLNISKKIPRKCVEFLEGLLRSCRPDSLSLTLSENVITGEFYPKTLPKLIEMVDNPTLNCCHSSEVKCWRHDLKSSRITLANNGKTMDSKDFLILASQYINAHKTRERRYANFQVTHDSVQKCRKHWIARWLDEIIPKKSLKVLELSLGGCNLYKYVLGDITEFNASLRELHLPE